MLITLCIAGLMSRLKDEGYGLLTVGIEIVNFKESSEFVKVSN